MKKVINNVNTYLTSSSSIKTYLDLISRSLVFSPGGRGKKLFKSCLQFVWLMTIIIHSK
eukprot:UN00252